MVGVGEDLVGHSMADGVCNSDEPSNALGGLAGERRFLLRIVHWFEEHKLQQGRDVRCVTQEPFNGGASSEAFVGNVVLERADIL